jgi:hypothetical protein
LLPNGSSCEGVQSIPKGCHFHHGGTEFKEFLCASVVDIRFVWRSQSEAVLFLFREAYNLGMRLLNILGFASLLVSVAWAQSTPTAESRGTLSGTVLDASGAVIAGAKVTLKGSALEMSIVTDSDGVFSFTALPKGWYSISVEKTVFKPAEIKGIEVEDGKPSTLRVTMVETSNHEIIEIIDPALTIDTTSSSPHNCITDRDMQSVPMDRSIGGAITMAGRCP